MANQNHIQVVPDGHILLYDADGVEVKINTLDVGEVKVQLNNLNDG